MARDKKYPNIDFHIHNELPPFVDVEKCKEQLVKHLLKFKQEIKVFFIGYPRINNIINTNIDLLLIVALENRERNFLIIENSTSGRNIYFNNLIIPIKFMDGYQESNIVFPNFSEENHYAHNILVDDAMELAIKEEISELKWGTKKYLERIWKSSDLNLDFSVFPYPIIWVLSQDYQHYDFRYSNVIYAPNFGFEEIGQHLKYAYFNSKSFSSVYQWSTKENKNNKESYLLIDKQVNSLIEQIEKDNKIGSLTKSKIERLNRQFAEDNKIYEKYLSEQRSNNLDDADGNIFDFVFGDNKNKKLTKLPERIRSYNGLKNNLVIISGKAGSGKTTEMLLLMKKSYENAKKISEDGNVSIKRSGYYLTYNKLLSYDVRYITDQYHSGDQRTKIRIKTIHKFIYDLVDKISVLSVMNHKRIEDIIDSQNSRHDKILESLEEIEQDEFDLDYAFKKLGKYWGKGVKDYYLLLKSYIIKRMPSKNKYKYSEIESVAKDFLKEKLRKIISQENRNTFLTDYYEVLRNIILILEGEIEELYKKLDIENLSDEIWTEIMKDLGKSYNKTLIDFKRMINRSFGGVRRQSEVLFIDEAQDCHPLERDIFLLLWKEKDIVVCSGGKEQLIRHSAECNWRFNDVTGKPLHNVITIEKRSKTYRMKPNLVKLCNFIAEKFEIKLDLSAHKTDIEDLGNVIIEFGDDKNYTKSKKVFDRFIENGKINKLTNYESVLFLSESNSDILSGGYKEGNIFIDSENNILSNGESVKNKETKLGKVFDILEDELFLHNQMYLDNNEDVDKQYDELDEGSNRYIDEAPPRPDQYRSIFYESCRGLEAWSVICFDLDSFYQRKYDEELAASYLSDDLFLTESQRREKYAITWVLMALTRPIDSLYIHLNMKLLRNKDEGEKIIGFTQDMDSKLKLINILAEYAGYEIDESHKIKSLNSSMCFESDWEDIPF